MKYAVIGCAVLGACSAAQDGRDIVAASLRDPLSAQFRNVRDMLDAKGGKHLCGEVNGKNAYGGYTGFTRFVLDKADSQVTFETDLGQSPDAEVAKYGVVAFKARWLAYCTLPAS